MRETLLLVLLIAVPNGATAQVLTRAGSSSDTTRSIFVIAEGNVRSAIGGTNGEQHPATGSVGIVTERRGLRFTALISVGSTVDTVSSGFGATLLQPGSGSALHAGVLDVRFADGPLNISGTHPLGVAPHFYLSASSAIWGNTERAERVTIIGAGASLSASLLDDSIGATPIVITSDLGLAFRSIGGDIGSEAGRDFQFELLGTKAPFFWGPEVGFSIQVGEVIAALSYYFMLPRKDILGFTNGQATAGISIQAGLIGK